MMSFQEEPKPQEQWEDFQQTEESYTYSIMKPVEEDILSLYKKTIHDDCPQGNIRNLSEAALKHHRIALVGRRYKEFQPENYNHKGLPILLRSLHYGYHSVYTMVIGAFKLQLKVLHIHRNSDDCDLSLLSDQIGSGSFGSVRMVKLKTDQFAIKRIPFLSRREPIDEFDIQTEQTQKDQLEKALQQYGIYKICSLFRIGPQIIFRSNYDIICYNNCIQFLMELCPEYRNNGNEFLDQFQDDLTNDLKILHSLHMVHRDIKPDNILFSRVYNKFVFTDFGLTHTVRENFTQKSQTHFSGTFEYASEELKTLSNGGKGKVNLYVNDFCGLMKTFEKMRQQKEHLQTFSRNSMSYQHFQAPSFENFSFDEPQPQLSPENSQKTTKQFKLQSYETKQSLSPTFKNPYLVSLYSTIAPKSKASQINFYQSQILYDIFQHLEQKATVTKEDIKSTCKRYLDDLQDSSLESVVKRYVTSVFYPQNSQQQGELTLLLGQLKNYSRQYSPRSVEVSACIKDIIENIDDQSSMKPQIGIYFSQLKETLLKGVCYKLQVSKDMLNLLIYLKKYDQIIDFFIRMLRKSIWFVNNNIQPQVPISTNYELLCCLYIISLSSQLVNFDQMQEINSLFFQLWSEEQKNTIVDSIEALDRPSTSRVAVKRVSFILLKFSCQKLMELKYLHLPIYLKAFQCYIESLVTPDPQEIHAYFSYIAKFEQLSKSSTKKDIEILSSKYLMIEIYAKICKHIPKSRQNIYKIVNQIKDLDLQAKVYYFSALNRVAAFQISQKETVRGLQLCREVEHFLMQSQTHLNDLQRGSLKIDLYKNMGAACIQNSQNQSARNHLHRSKATILSIFSKTAYIKLIIDITRNIALSYYNQNNFQAAIQSYEQLLIQIQQSKRDLILDKAFIYRSLLINKIKLGEKSSFGAIIRKIVDLTVMVVEDQGFEARVKDNPLFSQNLFQFFTSTNDLILQISLIKTLRRNLLKHLPLFSSLNQHLNLKLFKLYNNDMKMPDKALTCLSLYIHSKNTRKDKLDEEYYHQVNYLADRLISLGEFRKAEVLLKAVVFLVPLEMQKQREITFRLYHKALVALKNPWSQITSELIKDQFYILSTHRCSHLRLRKELSSNQHWTKLTEKWVNQLTMRSSDPTINTDLF